MSLGQRNVRKNEEQKDKFAKTEIGKKKKTLIVLYLLKKLNLYFKKHPYETSVAPYSFSGDLLKHLRYKWRRQWQPTPVLLPGKSHGWRSLVGCSPWGHEESDMSE